MAEQGVQTAAENNGTASQFCHQALPDPKTYVRLLELDVIAIGDTTTELRCKVTTWHVDHAPSYHAISYVWGDPKVTTNIKVDGNDLQITTNGDYALRQAQWFGVRYVWMDSICIDQYDAKEKGYQVGMMGNIYRRASCVVSCVGPHSENSEVLMRISSKSCIPSSEWIYWNQYYNPYSRRSGLFLQKLSLLAWLVQTRNIKKETVLNPPLSFMKRPYFTRLWVLQEVSMAKGVIICCGIDHRPIAELYGLHSMLHYILSLDNRWLTRKQRLIAAVLFPYAILSETMKNKWGYKHNFMVLKGFCVGYCENVSYRYLEYGASNVVEGLSLLLLLNLSKKLECQDPRDRIYRILSMVEWKDIPPIEPDYNIDALDVALKAMETIRKQTPAIHHTRALRLVDSLNRAMMLHLTHETPKYTGLERHILREFRIQDLNSRCFRDPQWFLCKITKDQRNNWRLGIRFDSNHDRDRMETRCIIHKEKFYCQQRFSFQTLEYRIWEEYVQVEEDEGGLKALLPQDTQPGDLLLTIESYARFEDYETTKRQGPRYLVLRKVSSRYYSIVGQAIVAGGCTNRHNTISRGFGLYFADRDALNLAISWAQCPAYEEEDLSLMTWDMARELLDLKVCNHPFSSYAVEELEL